MKSLPTFVLCLAMLAAGPTLAADSSGLAEIDAKVQAEEAIRAVKRLQNAYAHYLSDGLWNEAADLFTDEATGIVGTETIRGKEALRAWFMRQAGRAAQGLAEGQLHTHLNYQPIVNLGADGTSAAGTWHELALLGRYNAFAEWKGGIYENEYTLDDGVWKISRLRYVAQYGGAYDDYGHKAPPAWNVPYHFEAARVGLTLPPDALAAIARAGGPRDYENLAHRVQLLADETAVQNLQHAFGYYLDRKMYDDVADLFTESGTIEIGHSGVYAGKRHVNRLLEALYGRPALRDGELFDHINLGTVVTVSADGRSAASRTSQLSQLGRNGEYAHWELGTYENSYVKEDGLWKLGAVRYFPRIKTDYDLGWAVDAQAADATRTTTWDRAPTHAYASYPNAHIVHFHYAHPVTGRPPQYPDTYVALRPDPAATVDTRTGRLIVDGMGATQEDLRQLERRLDAAIAVDAVENLMSSYGYYIDESAWDNMAATFASKGSKEITGVGMYVGPERIREILNRRGPRTGRSPTFFTIHQLVQPVIHISEDGTYANARTRLFQSGGNADGSSGSWIGGIYENTAFLENGEWKFGRQDLHHLFNASYRNGWARVGPSAAQTADANSPSSGPEGRAFRGGGITQGLGGAAAPNQFAADYPPDGPIRARQYVFPDITVTAFHYNNPVSGRAPRELLP